MVKARNLFTAYGCIMEDQGSPPPFFCGVRITAMHKLSIEEQDIARVQHQNNGDMLEYLLFL